MIILSYLVEFAPYSLAPTGIGYGKVDGVLVEIVPIYTRGQMTERIEVIVCKHPAVQR